MPLRIGLRIRPRAVNTRTEIVLEVLVADEEGDRRFVNQPTSGRAEQETLPGGFSESSHDEEAPIEFSDMFQKDGGVGGADIGSMGGGFYAVQTEVLDGAVGGFGGDELVFVDGDDVNFTGAGDAGEDEELQGAGGLGAAVIGDDDVFPCGELFGHDDDRPRAAADNRMECGIGSLLGLEFEEGLTSHDDQIEALSLFEDFLVGAADFLEDLRGDAGVCAGNGELFEELGGLSFGISHQGFIPFLPDITGSHGGGAWGGDGGLVDDSQSDDTGTGGFGPIDGQLSGHRSVSRSVQPDEDSFEHRISLTFKRPADRVINYSSA